ncbi:hypothetical protein BBJ28_00018630 [Nothophytophthora sp. Chile5]|nr:hypothetical protein BBJ28_00018630 [Nothophytophthora sp. Chile5]
MPQFVARCLEEIGLEGRCGLPVRDLFALTDRAGDVAYRRYAWRVLRGMNTQLHFHLMRPLKDDGSAPRNEVKMTSPEETKPLVDTKGSATPGRKRKWSTTLLNGSSYASPEAGNAEEGVASGDRKTRKRPKQKHQPLQPVLPSMRRIAAKKQRRRLSEGDGELSEDSMGMGNGATSSSTAGKSRLRRRQQQTTNGESTGREEMVEDGGGSARRSEATVEVDEHEQEGAHAQSPQQQNEAEVHVKKEAGDAADETQWVLRSPRGYRLGDEVNVAGLSYEDAVAFNEEGVLGVVACEELRLKYLGVLDPSAVDTISPQFDLLEIIGRAREQGENAATLTNSRLFGDSRKLHYLLDMLVGANYVVKNIVTADQRRFNMVHLRRFASRFHPSMLSATATIEREAFPKELLAQVIVGMLKARGERTCVFADIGREMGYGKRHQEQLRNYFVQQMHANPNFPLQLFMARCNTGKEYTGRKLWCLRLRDGSCSSRRRESSGTFEKLEPVTGGTGRPVVERGIMEQMFVAIQDRQLTGATVPELRDVLGVPTFKLPYKLAQGLISNYNISVEQVVLGKSTMYRLFVPGAASKDAAGERAGNDNVVAKIPNVGGRVTRSAAKNMASSVVTKETDSAGLLQPSTMKEATRGVVRASTFDRRRNFIVKRVKMDKIVSIHQLRSGLIELERTPDQIGGTDWGVIDIRSVRRIIDDLVEEKTILTMDVTLPPKQVLQKAHRVVKCVVLPGYQHNREAIRKFVQTYETEQQKKYLANLGDHDNDGYIVVSSRRRQRGNTGTVVEETHDQEVVKYSAASYKLARVQLVKLHKQGRKLGAFFGMMYKCRAFHLMLWDRIELLSKQDAIDNRGGTGLLGVSKSSRRGTRKSMDDETSSDGSREVIFALKDVLDLLTVKEYVQLVGVSELLTEVEESSVRMAVSRGYEWDALPDAITQKVRGCEADRFSKILRVLLELNLLQVVNETSGGLFNIFQSSDDFDSMVSKVAFATLSGGLFRIKRHVRISVKRGATVLRQLPSEHSYVYAPGFSCKSRSEHFSGRIPLDFAFDEADDAKEYWKSLRFLSVEGARLGNESPDADGVSVNLDAALIRSAPLPDHNIYALKAWVPHATTTASNSSARAKAAAAAAGSIQLLKHKRFHSGGSSSELSSLKRRKLSKPGKSEISPFMTPVDTSAGGVSKFRKQVGTKRSLRASKWTLAEDLQLMDLYLDRMSCRWFVEVPLALQCKEERVAFRTTTLARTLISWKELAKALNKKPTDCMLRVNELMEAPAIQARVERTKVTITQMKNPGGDFHEELAIMCQPRLTALLCRALQVIFHERASYYSVLADMLINNWEESDVKLVWRYLWLAGLITRTSKANEGKDQKQRGFQVHSKVYEMKSLKIPRYPMATFCEAAEYLSFVNENVEEAAMVAESFEHEIEINVSAGQAAVGLSSTVSGFSHLVPSYVVPEKQAIDSIESKRAMTVKGLAGHLAGRWGGASPEDFLKDYWTVKSVFGISDRGMQAEKTKTMEAFATSGEVRPERVKSKPRPKRKKRLPDSSLSSWLSITLAEAMEAGLALSELCEKFATSGLVNTDPDDSSCKSGLYTLLQREVDEMLREGSVLQVNGYDHIRFVLREFADMWTLHPYRIASDSSKEKVHFLFEKDNTVIARPWFHLDGSANTKMALTLKRKVVNIVMCCPGIRDSAVHMKMRKIVSLQDMRSLLEELMADEIIYARVYRDPAPPATSIFGTSASSPKLETKVLTVLPGELRYVDFSQDRLHYFPAINCMELLGEAACDADLGQTIC